MYSIIVDSACDISAELLGQWNVKSVSLSFLFEGDTTSIENDKMSAAEFYSHIRNGKNAKTSAVNSEKFSCVFREELEEGNDILYLGFSSGLSATYASANIAAEDLREEYPNRTIVTVDTLAASAGFGLLLYLVTQEKSKGATLNEAAQFAENIKLNICHWFTVDTLEYLKRGGRVSSATALLGGMLDIKPLMHVDNDGHLTAVKKVRGRKKSIYELAQMVAETAIDNKKYPIFISHGDCLEDAQLLAAYIKELCNTEVFLITDVGPVIGAHSGPGTLALFFVGNMR